jgi:uncharacterized Zn-finger protein
LSNAWGNGAGHPETENWSCPEVYPASEESMMTVSNTSSIGPLHAGLLAQIGTLDLATRQHVAQLVDLLQPGIVQKQAGEWSFSINQLSDATVAQIYHELSPERAAPETAWTVPNSLVDSEIHSPKRSSVYSLEPFLPRSKRFKMEETSDECSSEESLSDYTNSMDEVQSQTATDDVLACPVCRRCFPGLASMNKHMRVHHDERHFSCTHPGCTKRFSHSSTLKDHMNIHLQRKPYTCKECGKGFPNGSNLNRHARIHTKSKPYVCPVCNKAFSQSSNLRVHQKIHDRPTKAD